MLQQMGNYHVPITARVPLFKSWAALVGRDGQPLIDQPEKLVWLSDERLYLATGLVKASRAKELRDKTKEINGEIRVVSEPLEACIQKNQVS